MPHTLAQRREWRKRPEVKERLKAADRRYYQNKAKFLYHERKKVLAEFSCIACGESEPCCIDWHHVNKREKEFNIATGMRRGVEVWWDEILKCVPLCANCHRKLHNNLLCLIPPKLK